jgi:hypothetical protein
MPDLRERLQELADAATREGVTPGPGHAIRRGRRRRRRIAAGIASLLAVVLAAGAAVTGRLPDRTTAARPLPPAVSSPLPKAVPSPQPPAVQSPPPTTIPPPLPDGVRRNRPRPGSAEDHAFHTLATELRRCPGGASVPTDLIAYVWSRKYRRFWMVAAKRPPSPETRYCWTAGLFDVKGRGGLWGARRIGSPDTPLTTLGGIYSGFAQIEGRVTKRAARVRLRFRDGRPPMYLTIVQAGNRYPANFFVGFFPQAPTSAKQGGWAAATATALDAAGRTVATCRVGPPGDGTPKCPGN